MQLIKQPFLNCLETTTYSRSQQSHTVEKCPQPSLRTTWYLLENRLPICTGWYPPANNNTHHVTEATRLTASLMTAVMTEQLQYRHQSYYCHIATDYHIRLFTATFVSVNKMKVINHFISAARNCDN